MKRLTEGSISLVQDGKISIEEHQKSADIPDGSDVLVIRSRSGFLRIIPVHDGLAFQVRVSLDLASFTQTSRLLYETIRNMNLKLLHSTGFCPFEDENYCIWEGYFLSQDRDNIEEFVEWLRGLEVVLEVDLVTLTL
ncbi:MAG: hypothetical protein KAQ65_10445 [Candidatus Thorarchaeota archaeon]|nr:hypothetical protein [Candidatus Thorarchaeota archaeon]MCK5238041.1 hypothetical protein [Candidatus Thorarchaeota archaeon]